MLHVYFAICICWERTPLFTRLSPLTFVALATFNPPPHRRGWLPIMHMFPPPPPLLSYAMCFTWNSTLMQSTCWGSGQWWTSTPLSSLRRSRVRAVNPKVYPWAEDSAGKCALWFIFSVSSTRAGNRTNCAVNVLPKLFCVQIDLYSIWRLLNKLHMWIRLVYQWIVK